MSPDRVRFRMLLEGSGGHGQVIRENVILF